MKPAWYSGGMSKEGQEPFDWGKVHDFDPSEAGRTSEEAERMAEEFVPGSDIPESPEHLRDDRHS